ncbi:MAG: DUF3467 domain-containing protein [archaeon]|nr:DUF3467 domain-containing protein [archaeon]MCP8314462.1 DUF3467 domain-containing protein [archaeon]MCP8317523.1 DUF3467 domain-containing protein [archaeon]MCP8320744.1 DUF3467 domain-containing protein [archaeon]
MSEEEKTKPIPIDKDVTKGVLSNHGFSIGFMSDLFHIDFLSLDPISGEEYVVARIFLTPSGMKTLAKGLSGVLKKYEEMYAPIAKALSEIEEKEKAKEKSST